MRDGPILLVSTEPLLQVLIAAWIQFQFPERVQFPSTDEKAIDAVRRVQPAIIVVDVEHPDGFSDAFLDAMRAQSLPVLAFGREQLDPDIGARARRFSIEPVTLPTNLDELHGRISQALG